MISYLKTKIKRNIFLFFLLKRLTDKFYKDKKVTNQSVYLLEGYQSSGNSFLYTAFRVLHPDCKGAHHFHSVAHLKLALKYKVDGFIIFREPVSAISSRIVTFDIPLDEAIADYIDFYHFTLKRCAHYFFIDFDQLILNPKNCVNQMEAYLGLEQYKRSNEELNKLVKNEMVRWTEEQNLRSRLPDKGRSQLKVNVSKLIEDHDKHSELKTLYDRLLRKTIN